MLAKLVNDELNLGALMEKKDKLKLVKNNSEINLSDSNGLSTNTSEIRNPQEPLVSYDVVKLLSEALEHAEKGHLISISLVAVDSNNRVRSEYAGDIKSNIAALNGGIVKQLFSLNLGSILL